jgi:hypothetical protein
VLACQAAGVAVFGLYPLVFTAKGYSGQLAWLLDTAACGGQQAYTTLLQGSREGPLQLPQHIEVLTESRKVHLGPELLTPTTRNLARMPRVTVTSSNSYLMVKHVVAEEEELDGEGEEEEEPPEEQKPEEKKKEEKKEEEDEEEEEGEEIVERKEKAGRDDVDELKKFRKEDAAGHKKLYVDISKLDVSVEQLRRHLQQYGEVEDIHMSKGPYSNFATITMASPVVAGALLGAQHTLQRSRAEGGTAVLRLRGGSGRMPRVPPQQQQQMVCPLR